MPWTFSCDERLIFVLEGKELKDARRRKSFQISGVAETPQNEQRAREKARKIWDELKAKEAYHFDIVIPGIGHCGEVKCAFSLPRLVLTTTAGTELGLLAHIELDPNEVW